MSNMLGGIKEYLGNIRTDIRTGKYETDQIIKIFLWGLVGVCGMVVGGVC